MCDNSCLNNNKPTDKCKYFAKKALKLSEIAEVLGVKAAKKAKEARILGLEAKKCMKCSYEKFSKAQALFNEANDILSNCECLGKKAAIFNYKAVKCYANCPVSCFESCRQLRCKASLINKKCHHLRCEGNKVLAKATELQNEAICYQTKAIEYMEAEKTAWKEYADLVNESQCCYEKAAYFSNKAMNCYAYIKSCSSNPCGGCNGCGNVPTPYSNVEFNETVEENFESNNYDESIYENLQISEINN